MSALGTSAVEPRTAETLPRNFAHRCFLFRKTSQPDNSQMPQRGTIKRCIGVCRLAQGLDNDCYRSFFHHCLGFDVLWQDALHQVSHFPATNLGILDANREHFFQMSRSGYLILCYSGSLLMLV